MTPANDSLADVYDAAATWHERKAAPGWSFVDEAELAAWLDADPEHLDAYAAMGEADDLVEAAAGSGILDAELAQARAAFHRGRALRSRRSFGLMAAGLAGAAVLVGAGGALWLSGEGQTLTYAAAPGERTAVVLADGSRADLDGGAEIRARIGRRTRAIELVRGRAFFDVAHDPGRPFEVGGGGHVVRALGTAFEVDLTPAGGVYSVALLRGRVRVSGGETIELAPGQMLRADAGGQTVSTGDVAAVTAWREGRLVLRGEPLSEAVAEVNRRGGRRIVVRGAARDLKVSGAFSGDDPETFARAVAAVHGLLVDRASDGTIVLSPFKDSGAAAD